MDTCSSLTTRTSMLCTRTGTCSANDLAVDWLAPEDLSNRPVRRPGRATRRDRRPRARRPRLHDRGCPVDQLVGRDLIGRRSRPLVIDATSPADSRGQCNRSESARGRIQLVVATPRVRRFYMGRPAGWMKELTGRSPMKSLGAPSLRREIERKFWVEVANGLTSVSGHASSDWPLTHERECCDRCRRVERSWESLVPAAGRYAAFQSHPGHQWKFLHRKGAVQRRAALPADGRPLDASDDVAEEIIGELGTSVAFFPSTERVTNARTMKISRRRRRTGSDQKEEKR